MSQPQEPSEQLIERPPSPPNTGVRRHHTISTASRSIRGPRHNLSEEDDGQQLDYNDDEFVDQDWVGGVGAVGEKSNLHRQASLPTRYHRAFQGTASRAPGTLTPRGVNSLSAIAGHDGDEEDWEREMRAQYDYHQETQSVEHDQGADTFDENADASPIPSQFNRAPSPPTASGVRRHQSLTHGPASGPKPLDTMGLRRSGTLQATMKHSNLSQGDQSPSPPNDEDEYADDGHSGPYADDAYVRPPGQQQSATSPVARGSPWNAPGEWRTPGGSISSTGSNNIDDVQRALSNFELSGNNYNQQAGYVNAPPRFATSQSVSQGQNVRNGQNGLPGTLNNDNRGVPTSFGGRKTPVGSGSYPEPIGRHQRGPSAPDDRSSSGNWEAKERVLSGRSSNPNLQYNYAQLQQARPGIGGVPNVPAIPQQYVNQQGAPRMAPPVTVQQMQQPQAQAAPSFGSGPVDVPTLVTGKGYNPADFDIKPSFARYFVIKSYTEDDVHKSLKYEIWSSTDPGNKRLDKAFKESAGRGPIYLFFSVNASGHFCGMAEMLTPVDYTRSSNVWASDKWKGVFKVRWIYIRDIPNATLRHIRLHNTQERKPVTNSRDTQELLPDAGQEMLRIFHSHPARTSLLQDFAFYELQAMQKMQSDSASSSSSPPPQAQNILAQPPQPQNTTLSQMPQNGFAMPQNPSNMGFPGQHLQMPQMNPMMGMQMNIPLAAPYGIQTPTLHQTVMRHASPAPPGAAMQNFASMGGTPQF